MRSKFNISAVLFFWLGLLPGLSPAAAAAAVTAANEAAYGHSIWSKEPDGVRTLIITGESAERAFNDPLAIFVSDDDHETVKTFGPLRCKYIKADIQKSLGAWTFLRIELLGWYEVDFKYECAIDVPSPAAAAAIVPAPAPAPAPVPAPAR